MTDNVDSGDISLCRLSALSETDPRRRNALGSPVIEGFGRALALTVLIALNPACQAETLPRTPSIANITVGVSTFSDAKNRFGQAEPFRVSAADGAELQLCYRQESPNGTAFLIFESGAMGGWNVITGIRMSTLPHKGQCTPTKVDIISLETTDHVHLGQSKAEFLRVFDVTFKEVGSLLIFENTTRRPATSEEIEGLSLRGPDGREYYFDVSLLLEASFSEGALVEFYASRIEAY